MIPVLHSIEDIDKIIRATLISQSQIEPDYVRNSDTVFGQMLDAPLSDDVFESITHTDLLMLFELHSRESDSDMTETVDDKIVSYKAFKVHVIVYGDLSADCCSNVIARLRTQKVRSDLQSSAVYLERVSEMVELREFKASTVWTRHDFDIDISCRLQINQINDDYDVSSLSSIDIEQT